MNQKEENPNNRELYDKNITEGKEFVVFKEDIRSMKGYFIKILCNIKFFM